MDNDKYCLKCGKGAPGWIIEDRDDPIYDKAAVPCPVCNPDPPKLGEKRIKQ